MVLVVFLLIVICSVLLLLIGCMVLIDGWVLVRVVMRMLLFGLLLLLSMGSSVVVLGCML